jgi:hypothetical protein
MISFAHVFLKLKMSYDDTLLQKAYSPVSGTAEKGGLAVFQKLLLLSYIM